MSISIRPGRGRDLGSAFKMGRISESSKSRRVGGRIEPRVRQEEEEGNAGQRPTAGKAECPVRHNKRQGCKGEALSGRPTTATDNNMLAVWECRLP